MVNATPRKILVIGAGSGIGAAAATHFHEHGDHVVAVDYREHSTPASRHLQCDLRDPHSIAEFLSGVDSDWDAVAHVAGIPGTAPPLDVLSVNYLGLRAILEGILPRMRRGGAILAVASTAGMGWQHRAETLGGLLQCTDAAAVAQWWDQQDPSYPVYNVSKEAAILFVRRLAPVAWRNLAVRVNTISPGPVHTPILADFEQSMGIDALELARNTVGRHAVVADIVPAIDFLLSDGSRWINGQDIQVDGGFISALTSGPHIELQSAR